MPEAARADTAKIWTPEPDWLPLAVRPDAETKHLMIFCLLQQFAALIIFIL